MSETLRIRDGTAVDAAQSRALADFDVVEYEPGGDPEDRTVSGGRLSTVPARWWSRRVTDS